MYRKACNPCTLNNRKCNRIKVGVLENKCEKAWGFDDTDDTQFVEFTNKNRVARFPGHPEYPATPLRWRNLTRHALGKISLTSTQTLYELKVENERHWPVFVGISHPNPVGTPDRIDGRHTYGIWTNGSIKNGRTTFFKKCSKYVQRNAEEKHVGLLFDKVKNKLYIFIDDKLVHVIKQDFKIYGKDLFLTVTAWSAKVTITFAASNTGSSLQEKSWNQLLDNLRAMNKHDQEKHLNALPVSFKTKIMWFLEYNTKFQSPEVCKAETIYDLSMLPFYGTVEWHECV